jgi:ankyrin repeat protein
MGPSQQKLYSLVGAGPPGVPFRSVSNSSGLITVEPSRQAPTPMTRLLITLLLTWCLASAWADDELWASALKQRDWETLQTLVTDTPEVDLRTHRGATALMLAAGAGRRDLVVLLLEAGAEVDATNDFGGTALMYASTLGDLAAVDLLLERGARVDAVSTNGWTAVTLAAVKGRAAVLSRLLDAGADANAADIYGWTPLMRAVQGGRSETVRVLLESDATDLRARNDNGATALHYAALGGHVDMVQWLLDRGADPACSDKEGDTPLTMASARGHAAVVDLLKRRMSR